MADLSPKDINQLSAAITRLEQFLRGSGLNVGSAKRSRPSLADYEPEELTRATKRQVRSLADYQRSLTTLLTAQVSSTKQLSALSKEVAASASSLKQMNTYLRRLHGKELVEATVAVGDLSNAYFKASSEAAKASRASSMLTQAMLQNAEQLSDTKRGDVMVKLHRSINDLVRSSATLSDIAKSLKLYDDELGQLRSDLELEDYAKLAQTMGEVQATIAEANKEAANLLEELVQGAAGNKQLQLKINELLDKEGRGLHGLYAVTNQLSDDLQALSIEVRERVLPVAAALPYRTAEALGAHGVNSAALQQLPTKDLLAELGQLSRGASAANGALLETAINASKLSISAKSATEWLKRHAGQLASSTAVAANLNKAFHALLQTYQQIVRFNTANIATSFLNVYRQAIKLGLSFEETAKLLSENGQIASLWLGDKLDAAFSTFKESFEKAGYTAPEAAESLSGMLEVFTAKGINLRSISELGQATDKFTAYAKQLGAMTGLTVQQVARLDQELLSTEDIFKTLMGMDVERRKAYADELVQLRNLYVQQGLSIDQAQELVKQQQAQLRAPVRERFRQAAMLQMAAAQAGISPEAAAMAGAIIRRGRAGQTPENLAFLNQVLGQVQQSFEQQVQQGNLGAEVVMERLLGESGLGQLYTAGLKTIQAREVGKARTDAELAAAVRAAEPYKPLTQLTNILNSISALLDSTLGTAAKAAGAALAGTAISALFAARALGGVALAGGVAAGGAAGGLLGGGKLLRAGKLGGAGAAIGLGGSLLGQAIGGKVGTGIDVGADILGGALAGAGVGSLLGPVGTVVGGLIGGGVGIITNMDKLRELFGSNNGALGQPGGPVQPPINIGAEVIEGTRGLGDKVLSVTDSVATEYLKQLVTLMREANELMRGMAFERAPATAPRAGAAVGANAYLNGNGPP